MVNWTSSSEVCILWISSWDQETYRQQVGSFPVAEDKALLSVVRCHQVAGSDKGILGFMRLELLALQIGFKCSNAAAHTSIQVWKVRPLGIKIQSHDNYRWTNSRYEYNDGFLSTREVGPNIAKPRCVVSRNTGPFKHRHVNFGCFIYLPKFTPSKSQGWVLLGSPKRWMV